MRLHIISLVVLVIACYIHSTEGWRRWRAPRIRVRLPRVRLPKIKLPKVKTKDLVMVAKVGFAAARLAAGDPTGVYLLGAEIVADKVAKNNPNSNAAKALKTAVDVANGVDTAVGVYKNTPKVIEKAKEILGKKREVREVKLSSNRVDIQFLYGLNAIERTYGALNFTRGKRDMEDIMLTCDMTHYDEDWNEEIDKIEFKKVVEEDGFGNYMLLFTALDSNGDKIITKDEFEDMAPTLSERSIFPDCKM